MDKDLISSLEKAYSRDDKISLMTQIINLINNGTRVGDEIYLPYLIKFLDDEDDFVRIKATELAEYYKDEKILEKLIQKLLYDKSYFVRGFAAKALGSIGNIKAKEYLEKASFDSEGFVVSFAVQSLKTINMKVSFGNKLDALKAKMKESKK